ncbi:protein crumbs homolog 3 [Mixophyes fleayi]|uniref:protein crumbs homolog 3 n=1 Tax=Mixophyes fleayi TaxID=3061075 RepID=UPI003F4E2FAF
MDPFILLVLFTTVVSTLSQDPGSNETSATPSPTGLSGPERLAAIIVPSIVGGLLLIGIVVFLVIKVKEKRQTEGTYRPSNEEQVGSRTEPNAALKLPPEERLI